MKVITPTPSQAAVVLKKFLQHNGVELPLSVTQEASARMRGYADWQALVSDVEPRTGRSRNKSDREKAIPARPQLFTLWRVHFLGVLLLHGTIEFDDCAARQLVLRHEIALKALAFGQRGPNVLLQDVVFSYRSKNGDHRKILVRDIYDAQDLGDGRWRLADGTGFHVRQVSLEPTSRACISRLSLFTFPMATTVQVLRNIDLLVDVSSWMTKSFRKSSGISTTP
jgi:hypothetical protein